MSTAAIRAGRAFVELFADSSKLVAGLKAGEAMVRQFGASVTKIGQGITKVFGALLGPLLAAGLAFSEIGDGIAKMARRTGLGTEAVSELAHAAGASGTSIDSLEKSLRKMQKTIVDAGDGAQGSVDALAKLGLTAADLAGKSPEQQLEMFADRIAAIDDPAERAAAALEIFGKSGAEMIPLLEEGAEGIRALRQEARDLGLSFDPADAASAEQLNDAIGRLQGTLKKTFLEVGAAVAPILTEWADKLTSVMPGIIQWTNENRSLIGTLMKIAAVGATIGVVIIGIGQVCTGAAALMGGLVIASAKLKAALTLLAAHPVAAVLLAIALAASACAIALGEVKAADVSDVFQKAVSAGDKQRESTQQLIKRLEQLSQKQKLSSAETAEAESLIARLASTYGDLGISIDATTGKITGVTEAQGKLNKLMKDAALAEVNAAMQEVSNNMKNLNQEMEEASGWWANTTFGGGGAAKMEDLGDQLAVEQAKLNAIIKKRDAIKGDEEGSLTGKGPATPEDTTAANLAKQAADVAKAREDAMSAEERWAQIEEEAAAKRRTRLQQELKDIADLAAERRKLNEQRIAGEQAREGGPRKEVLDQLGFDAVRIDAEEKIATSNAVRDDEQAKKKEEQANREQIAAELAAGNGENADEIARLKIEVDADLTPLEKELKLIELDMQRELAAAVENGLDPDLIKERFDLEKKLAIQGADIDKAAEQATAGTTTGSFSAIAAQRSFAGGTAMDRTAKATEETARNTAKIADKQAQQVRFS